MLIILTTHPIQYQVPLWQALADNNSIPFEVWYLTDHAVKPTVDREFGKAFAWDLGRSTLEGYTHRFLKVKAGWTLHPSAFRGLRLDEDLRPLFRQVGATAVWIQGWQKQAYWQAAYQAKAEGLSVWIRGESNDLSAPPVWKWQVKRLWLWLLFRKIDRFLCIGSANRRLYRTLGVPELKLGSAPYFVDNARFAKQAETLLPVREAMRAEWGIPENAFCVLFCGKFIKKKRPMDLVLAANLVNHGGGLAKQRPLHLLFVGSGELGYELRQSLHVVFDADATGDQTLIAPNIPHSTSASFAGFLNQTQISRAYVAADCLVLPSDQGETWGLVVNEAMASGLTCVVSDACGSAEDLAHPVDEGLVFHLGDIAGLAASIEKAAQGGFGERRRAQIEKFSLERTLEEVVKEYKAVARRKAASD
jgi:glycosyltransferase involved in cell wall biosynthesis